MMRKKICFIVSTPYTAKAFLENHFEVLSQFYDIYLVANLDDNDIQNYSNPNLTAIKHIPINRKISVFKDLKALFLLIGYLFKNKFDVVTTFTPKAGLIGIMASKLAGIKNRIHFFTGQVWHTKTGLFKNFLIFLDKLVVAFSTNIIVDGNPQRDFLISHGIITSNNSIILGKGTISGLDLDKFAPNIQTKLKMRKELKLQESDFVFLFLGRLNIDKGIMDLVEAFKKLNKMHPTSKLLLIGPDEENLNKRIITNLDEGTYILYGTTHKPEDLIQAGDVFCLPSHREAFGLSILEASACEKPIICSDTYGLQDTIVANETGLRHKTHDVESLFEAMETLFLNESLRKDLGKNGRKYVERFFSKNILTRIWLEYYNSLLKNA
jgi:glycosyltransferase involved in cell wall biosynthesis